MTTEPILVVYDYGQGGVWAFVRAASRESIEKDYPELTIMEPYPEWMTPAELAELPVLVAKKPSGLLADLRRAR